MVERGIARVAVLGLGVMGGSLARALARDAPELEVRGWSPDPAERRKILDAGAADRVPPDWEGAVGGADLVVLAAPLGACRKMLGPVAELTGPETTLCDVASLKLPMLREASRVGVLDRWVGTHPMAGSEGAGYEHSRDDLYRGTPVWLVADPSARAHARRVRDLFERLGSVVTATDAGTHDRRMALVSHLPQLVSNALAAALEARGVARGELGPGGRDMTRLASGGVGIWRDLLPSAPADLAEALRAVAREAEDLAARLDADDTEAVVARMEDTVRWSARS